MRQTSIVLAALFGSISAWDTQMIEKKEAETKASGNKIALAEMNETIHLHEIHETDKHALHKLQHERYFEKMHEKIEHKKAKKQHALMKAHDDKADMFKEYIIKDKDHMKIVKIKDQIEGEKIRIKKDEANKRLRHAMHAMEQHTPGFESLPECFKTTQPKAMWEKFGQEVERNENYPHEVQDQYRDDVKYRLHDEPLSKTETNKELFEALDACDAKNHEKVLAFAKTAAENGKDGVKELAEELLKAQKWHQTTYAEIKAFRAKKHQMHENEHHEKKHIDHLKHEKNKQEHMAHKHEHKEHKFQKEERHDHHKFQELNKEKDIAHHKKHESQHKYMAERRLWFASLKKAQASGDDEDDITELWDGAETIHAYNSKLCLQLSGGVIASGRVDTIIADRFKAKGLKTEEGTCFQSGYTTQDISINNHQGIWLTVWQK